ncbi:hypothetical protein HHI36_017358 [Cryptolaemus montrouzieri]|uniref:Uncharacterized protein n=1 Tax=Cryptolaemus montrouzieri TaxID=559131 RepID=A0ABD2NN12_9CUCU
MSIRNKRSAGPDEIPCFVQRFVAGYTHTNKRSVTSSTLIDYLVTNLDAIFWKRELLKINISDHYAQHLSFSIVGGVAEKTGIHITRQLSDNNLNCFKSKKNSKSNGSTSGWISPDIVELRKWLDEYGWLLRYSGDQQVRDDYVRLKSEYKRRTELAKFTYYESKINSSSNKSKGVWNLVNLSLTLMVKLSLMQLLLSTNLAGISILLQWKSWQQLGVELAMVGTLARRLDQPIPCSLVKSLTRKCRKCLVE